MCSPRLGRVCLAALPLSRMQLPCVALGASCTSWALGYASGCACTCWSPPPPRPQRALGAAGGLRKGVALGRPLPPATRHCREGGCGERSAGRARRAGAGSRLNPRKCEAPPSGMHLAASAAGHPTPVGLNELLMGARKLPALPLMSRLLCSAVAPRPAFHAQPLSAAAFRPPSPLSWCARCCRP